VVKRQTLFMVLVFAVLAIGMGTAALTIQSKVTPKAPPRQVEFEGLTLRIPGSFGSPRRSRHERWEKLSYSGVMGNLLLAAEPADDRPLSQAFTQWFSLPGYARGPLRYEAGGSRWYFREIPFFGQGAYALQKRGKTLQFIACFSGNGRHYWIQLETRNTIPSIMKAFHEVLLSVREPDGSSPEPTLGAALDTIAQDCGWRFILPMTLPFMVPLIFLVLVFGIQLLVRGRSGRAPEVLANFREGGLEILLSGPGQLQYLDGAIGVTAQALTIYTFGTPFLVIPRSALAGRVSTGEGWFGAKFVLLDLEGPLEFQKYKWKFRNKRGTKIKIYCADPNPLYFALMN